MLAYALPAREADSPRRYSRLRKPFWCQNRGKKKVKQGFGCQSRGSIVVKLGSRCYCFGMVFHIFEEEKWERERENFFWLFI